MTTSLAFGMVAATMSISAVAILGPIIVREFEISRTGFGFLLTAYTVSAAGGSLCISRHLSDRVAPRRMLRSIFVLSAVALTAVAASDRYYALALSLMVAGGIESLGNPTTNRIISVLSHRDRGWVVGIKQSAAVVSYLICGLFLVPLSAWLGWRPAVLVLAVCMLLGTVLASKRTIWDAEAVLLEEGRSTARRRAPSSWTRRLAVIAFLMGIGDVAVLGYLPLFVHHAAGFDHRQVGWIGVLVGVSAVAGRITWGKLSVQHSWAFPVSLAFLAAGACASVLILVAGERMWAGLAWIAAVGLGATALSWIVIAMLAVMIVSGPTEVGRNTSIVVSGYLSGAVVGAPSFGALADLSDGYLLSWGFVALLYLVCFALCIKWRTARGVAAIA